MHCSLLTGYCPIGFWTKGSNSNTSNWTLPSNMFLADTRVDPVCSSSLLVGAIFFSIRREHDGRTSVLFASPNEGLMISKVLMITFDLLTARVHARAVSFWSFRTFPFA